MTVEQMFIRSVMVLAPRFGIDEARWMVRTIFEDLLDKTRAELFLMKDKELSDFRYREIVDILDRLLDYEPLQQILGHETFMGMKLKVTPDVLIPRPETAMLVDNIIRDADGRTDLRVLDLGTGSGCIALALARGLKFADVTAVDISAPALEVARENGRTLHASVRWQQGDMLSMPSEPDTYDIIVSNPPYVLESEKAEMSEAVLDHEPAQALFVPDADGLRFYTAVCRFAATSLKEGGRLYFECNPLTIRALQQYMQEHGWRDVNIALDDRGKERFINAIRP